MQALAIFACFDPTVTPWSADRESGVECFPILTDEESEAAGTGSVQSGRCGQQGACHYSRHHHVIRGCRKCPGLWHHLSCFIFGNI